MVILHKGHPGMSKICPRGKQDKWSLIVSNHNSKLPVFRMLPAMSSKNMIFALKSIFSENGDIKEIFSADRSSSWH